MSSSPWLIQETKPLDDMTLAAVDRDSHPDTAFATRGRSARPLAITLHDVVIHDVRKWFGGADIRIDALVVHGPAPGNETSIYQPHTFRFTGVRDGEKLAIDTGGLLIFLGRAAGFVDISIVISRDRRDSDTLDSLLAGVTRSDPLVHAAESIGAFALSGGAAALIGPAITAAGVLGELVYKMIKDISGDALGLYRGSWLQARDRLGVGPHPGDRPCFEIQDISFRYEIAVEAAGGQP